MGTEIRQRPDSREVDVSSSRQKVAVIGGGVGAITAAYAITQLPDWQDRYEITLYQMGWRLGGKGASGRNARAGERIEEHGLHIWAGFYDNAFRLMRDCYEGLVRAGLRDPGAPLGTLEKAFHGLDHFLLAEDVPQPDGSSALHPWRIDFEPNQQTPGSGGVIPSPYTLFRMLLARLADLLGAHGGLALTAQELPPRFQPGFRTRNLPLSAPSPLHALRAYADTLPEDARRHGRSERAELAALVAHAQDWHGGVLQRLPDSDTARRVHYLISLSLAFCRGAIAEGCFLDGFDAIDDREISDWLLHYGAAQDAVYSAVFRGCYDYVFGYPGGITDHRSVGAGTAIRGLLRLAFCYKGSLFFKMQAGMGDTIFAPYYQLLRHRGVGFRFFNAATRLVLDQEGGGIAAIEMVEQAAVRNGDYQPLREVAGLPCWPSEPLWDQIGGFLDPDFECERTPPRGRAYRLERGRDFDQVILGASLGSMPYLAPELCAASPRWRAMLDRVQTVATHAAQFWVDRTPEQLGWNDLVAAHNSGPQTDLQTVITAFAEPLDTWADMSDLLVRETWPDPGPASIAYFCSPCRDAGADPGTMQQRTRDWADSQLVRMWPGALKDGRFDAGILHAIGGGDDETRFAAQYFRENFFGSERYVLSVPDSVQYRLPPDGSGFDNLYLAGDWTRCGINAGCVEAATISGLAAARGLTGAEIEIVGEGDLAPDDGPGDAVRLASPYAQTAPWPLTPLYGTGSIDGFFSFHAVEAAALEAVLPDGMYLLPQGLTPAGTHPVAVLANQQIGVRMSILPRLLGYRNYFEAIVAINWVGIEGQDGIFSYLPNLYLDNRAAQWAGIWMYGFNKRMGRLSMGQSAYDVASPEGRPIWSGRYRQPGFSRPLMESPECAAVEALCQQVVVSRSRFGGWHYSAFDFNLTSARIAPVAARIEVSDPTLANLPAGEMSARPLVMGDSVGATRQQGLPGAFRIWTSWTLSNPFDSRRLAVLEAERARLP
ncbi:NAD(P)-binding protein [Paracoccus marinaquae]|uniref:NAD(P)-binding protein n=1 Tax=Paracoccus marinaquae TaxID=2841926 RepID=A0ABS6AES2_9RHOB|nr:NAD(P)-binding protein [Paracoccus marinaquae]MBU3029102.1 NAD(P)-binding protein [Paracoccus marinaquae]